MADAGHAPIEDDVKELWGENPDQHREHGVLGERAGERDVGRDVEQSPCRAPRDAQVEEPGEGAQEGGVGDPPVTEHGRVGAPQVSRRPPAAGRVASSEIEVGG